MLVGFITDTVTCFMRNLSAGKSKVVENEHTVSRTNKNFLLGVAALKGGWWVGRGGFALPKVCRCHALDAYPPLDHPSLDPP